MALPAQSERPQGEITTLLGRGSEFEGKLTFEGTVRIDGKLSGEIFSEDVLVVGEGAMVSAEIDVGVIIVEGNVTGNIRAKRAVELHAPARVKGNIETPSLYIDKGVSFEGFSKMENIHQQGTTNVPKTLQGLAEAAAKGGGGGSTPPNPSQTPPAKK
ncbi:MAG TPA: polymer-forming cytoskeletal protein [Polyangia bacterium]